MQAVCIREIQKSLKFSAKKLLEDKIRLFGVSHLFEITLTEIRRKDGTGIIIFQGMQDHTADSIKSLEGFNVAWIEEAQSLSERSMELLLPTIRAEGSEVWASWNPNNPEDPIEKLFLGHDGNDSMICCHVNFTNNIHVTDEILNEAARHKEASPETYDHVWLGVANSGTESAFIRPEWVRACIDSHKKIECFNNNAGRAVIGYDVADEEEHGSDTNASTFMRGSIIYDTKEWKDGRDVGASARSVFHDARQNRSDVVYDGVGMGAGTKSEFKRLNTENTYQVKAIAFIAGGKVENPDNNVSLNIEQTNNDFFANVKSQLWWTARQRIYNTYLAITKGKKFGIAELVSISSKNPLHEKLITELSRPKIDYDNNSRVLVESKKKMAQRNVKSPNLADSYIMCFYVKNDYVFVG